MKKLFLYMQQYIKQVFNPYECAVGFEIQITKMWRENSFAGADWFTSLMKRQPNYQYAPLNQPVEPEHLALIEKMF